MAQIDGSGDVADFLTTNELKQQLNLTDNIDDALVKRKLMAAAEYVEGLCGGELPSPIPTPLREAIMLLGAHLCENRKASIYGTGTVTSVPLGFDDMIAPYREWAF